MTKFRSSREYRAYAYALFICALVISKLDCRRCIMYTQRLHFQPAGGDRLTNRADHLPASVCLTFLNFTPSNWSGRSEFMKFVQASRISDRQTTRLFARARATRFYRRLNFVQAAIIASACSPRRADQSDSLKSFRKWFTRYQLLKGD